jgi:hypothetical protein
MAIQLEFLNFIVPVQVIEQKYLGGWAACLRDHSKSIGKVAWYDDHLFRTGTMDPDLMDNLIAKWIRLGFEATEEIGGKVVWKDLCVVTSYGVSQYGCPWIVVDIASRTAWLKGTEAGEVVGRDHLRR